jgi:hypothetical protein
MIKKEREERREKKGKIEKRRKMKITDLPNDLLCEIAKFHVTPVYKLRDWANQLWEEQKNERRLRGHRYIVWQSNPNAIGWIKSLDPEKICWRDVCCNPNPDVIPFIKENISKLNSDDWYSLAQNENAFDILQQHPDKVFLAILSGNKNAIPMIQNSIDDHKEDRWNKINWSILSGNENAIDILEKHIDKINWNSLSSNKGAMRILKKYPEKINWSALSENESDEAIDLLLQHPEKINYEYLSMNENERAIAILENNIDKIDWDFLSRNKKAIKILEQHVDKINWDILSQNENAIHLIEKNLDQIDVVFVGCNPNIFVIDGEKSKESYLDFVKMLRK